MKPRTTLLLLGVLALLCLAYWLTMVNEERVTRNTEMAKRLFDFKPEDVSSITIAREGEKATSGERREAGGWTVTAPYLLPANPVIWDRVATSLANLTSERTIEADTDDLDPYGLKEPILTVTAKTKAGEGITLSFGKMEPTQKFRYGKLEDGPLFLAQTNQFFELDRDLLWLRDRDLIKKEQEGITRIEYARMARADDAAEGATGPASWKESVSVVAERGNDGVWHIVEPEPAVADQEVLNNLASEIQFAVGRDYVDAPENLSDYKLDPPMARVRVRAGSQEQLQTFFLGSFSTGKEDEGGVFVMREGLPAVFVVDAQMVTLLPKDPNAWHEKRVITRQGSDITSLEYTAGIQHFKVETVEGKGWQVIEPADVESEQTAISQFISQLLSMKGADYWPEPLPEFGLDNPVISIRLTYKDVAEPASILVGAATPDGKSRYVTQDTGDVITLTDEQVKKLEITITDLAAKGLLAARQDEIQEVALLFDGVSYRFSKGEQAWKIDEPTGKVWESQSDMKALLAELSSVRATVIEQSPAPADLKPFGLDTPTLSVRLSAATAAPGGQTRVLGPLMVGALCTESPHERYAMVAGRTDLFRVKQTLVDTIRDALRGVVDATQP